MTDTGQRKPLRKPHVSRGQKVLSRALSSASEADTEFGRRTSDLFRAKGSSVPDITERTALGGLMVTYRDPANLRARAKNARTHSKRQIQQIAVSIKEFGFLNPILIDHENGIIAGHGRNEAAKISGITKVPTIQVDHLRPEQIRAYVIADNELAAKAGWDRELLALELKELSVNFDFDVTLTGFETAEIDLLINELDKDRADRADPADDVQEVDRSVPAVSRIGDLWIAGRHRILCGDATKRESYETLLGAKRAQMVFTDAPYNVRIHGHVCGQGKIRHHEFPMAAGEMTPAEFTAFLKTSCTHLVEFSHDGAIHALCMDWRHMREMQAAAEGVYSELKNLCVWVKTNGGLGSFYRSQHELVFIYKCGTAPHINNVELGRHGRNRTNVWTYPGVNTFGRERGAELAMHPTVKPLALVSDAILDCSRRGGVILDAFAGSGTTLIAAEKSGRLGYGIELDPYYVDTILGRFKDKASMEPVLSATGEKYADVKRRRDDERGHREPGTNGGVQSIRGVRRRSSRGGRQ